MRASLLPAALVSPGTPLHRFPLRPVALALLTGFLMTGCGGDGGDDTSVATLPAAPTGLGTTDTAPVQDATAVPPFVDNAATNQRGDARYATLQTNAGVRAVSGFLSVWQPSTQIVDAGVTAAANGSFPAVTASTWSGIPGDATDGKVLDTAAHSANIQYVVTATAARTDAQALAAYLDDRRGKGYSISDGMGPLTSAWRTAAGQTTSITSMPADATTVLYNDTGADVGVSTAAGNKTLGLAVDFINNVGDNASTEPAKRFYKYARPWRWSSNVIVVPQLVPAKSSTPTTDGGYISGHTAEGVRKALAMAYLVPQRFQEMMARSLELGENRILAGMHSPMDVIGGRILGQASAAAAIANGSNVAIKTTAYQQAQAAMQSAAGASSFAALQTYAHSAAAADDRFNDWVSLRTNAQRRMTFGLPQTGDKTKAAVVPKGAEVLLETRLPYLSADQRRVVLKTTALPSGWLVMDDAEGWGRLNYVAAADGYGAFNGDVDLTMDGTLGGFYAEDSWRNDIGGAGKLTKSGSGTLHLSGANTFSGGLVLKAGVISADSSSALGKGDVYLAGGTLVSNAAAPQVAVGGKFSQRAGSTLQVVLGGSGAGRLVAAGAVNVEDGATLNVKFAKGTVVKAGDTVQVLSGASLAGRYSTVTVDGFTKISVSYSGTALSIKIEG
ncbi:autotransporter-associated beta strand protein [Roseateles depolymerans]|uniref:Autotransporter-associated beta strand repeat protein n=2 Tax=Roseateles depolymerans TaxID=76731 RepID=A0A0U3MF65_9BURK|nr:Autotransporter-associated beta strand repeat protein [Roseateles depolymerans]REG22397.1 autotransporter-associated beta strand protein [Roseateles depolymerans]